MTDKEFESLFKNEPQLVPRAELKEEILARAQAELEKSKKKKQSPFYKRLKVWVPLAACIMLAVLVAGGMIGLNNEAYQTIYIDVNPSVAITLNRFERVNGVEYLNEDARDVFEKTELEGKSAEEALEEIIAVLDTEGYFEDEACIYISADEKAQETVDKLTSHAEKIKGNRKYKVSGQALSQEEKEEAKESGISPGKYRIISEIIELCPSYTVEELKNLPMAELNKIYKNLAKPSKKDSK